MGLTDIMTPGPRTQAQPDHRLDQQIADKAAAAHAAAFAARFPGQCQHIQRLIAERLQQGLHKSAPEPLTHGEVADLAQALWHITQIQRQ
jgi:hypothetical protein